MTEAGALSFNLMTTVDYNESSYLAPRTSSPIPPAAHNDDADNDAQVTSPAADAERPTTKTKKTRKKRKSSGKSEETGEEVAAGQVVKGLSVFLI